MSRSAPKPPPRMNVRLSFGDAPELYSDLSDLRSRARGARIRYLASLGLACDKAGLLLSGKVPGGELVFPGELVTRVANAAANRPAPPLGPPGSSASDPAVTAMALSLLDIV